MKKPDEEKKAELVAEEGFKLKLHPRDSEEIALRIPVDTLASLDRVAAQRDMSREALMKLYIGHGLRQDLAQFFAERVLEKTAQVLTRHIQSAEAVSTILREIRTEAAA
ncbi:MAG: hypothetical protein ACREBD_19085 [Blastocatellia bacterium]